MSKDVINLCSESSDVVRKTADDIDKVLLHNKSNNLVAGGGLSAENAKRTENLLKIRDQSRTTIQELNQMIANLVQSQDRKMTPGLGLGSRGDEAYNNDGDRDNGRIKSK